MAKLHELLSVAENQKSQADKARADLMTTFEKKRHLFGQTIQTFTPFAEGKDAVTEQQSDLQTTVRKELAWLARIWTPALDGALRIEKTNTLAKADIVLDDGTKIASDVPATALLELKKRLGELHAFVSAIPTLDPAKGFSLDETREDGVYVARPVRKTRTEKTVESIILLQPTDKHPGQAQLINFDKPIGTIEHREWSGLMTTADKADIIERVEHLQRAVQKARARANDITADTSEIGAAIFRYAFGR